LASASASAPAPGTAAISTPAPAPAPAPDLTRRLVGPKPDAETAAPSTHTSPNPAAKFSSIKNLQFFEDNMSLDDDNNHAYTPLSTAPFTPTSSKAELKCNPEAGELNDPKPDADDNHTSALSSRKVLTCRYCPGEILQRIFGDIWACGLEGCTTQRCSYCGLDNFSRHWTKTEQTCTFRSNRHKDGFNFLSLFVPYFSP